MTNGRWLGGGGVVELPRWELTFVNVAPRFWVAFKDIARIQLGGNQGRRVSFPKVGAAVGSMGTLPVAPRCS